MIALSWFYDFHNISIKKHPAPSQEWYLCQSSEIWQDQALSPGLRYFYKFKSLGTDQKFVSHIKYSGTLMNKNIFKSAHIFKIFQS